jgi:hypothetical protein
MKAIVFIIAIIIGAAYAGGSTRINWLVFTDLSCSEESLVGIYSAGRSVCPLLLNAFIDK